MSKKKLLFDFIENSKLIHNKYDYSLVNYKNMKTKVKIICPTHGIFEQTPDNHLNGKSGCIKCSIIKKSNKLRRTQDDFINKSILIHDNKYDYSLVEYKNDRLNIKIICKEHGVFEQRPYNHLNGIGCSGCSNNKKYTNEKFINKSNLLHNNKYDYSLVEYKNAHTKVKIICKEHGEFGQLPLSHLKGCGCPYCNESKGEREIKNFLNENNIKYEPQKSFKNCKDKRLLKFDFYLPEYNTCIEYDGEQHYKSKEYFGGEKGLEIIQKRDNIKDNYCKENNIYLLRIKYNDNIFNSLNKLINNRYE